MSDTHFRGRVAQKALLVKNEKVLITRDKDDLVWEIPGGRLDGGETPEEGILREIKEELGVDAKIDGVLEVNLMLHVRDNENMLAIYYLLSLKNENQEFSVDPKEVEEMEWVDEKNYKEYSYFPEYESVLTNYFSKISS